MALIDELVRSATVVAREETVVLLLDHVDFLEEIGKNPSVGLELMKTLSQRIRALEKILMNSFGGLLPICMNCKNIRDEQGAWVRIEDFIADRSEAEFTHGICPDCMRKLYPKHFIHEQQ
jgi:CRP-like cAMP-binding protein